MLKQKSLLALAVATVFFIFAIMMVKPNYENEVVAQQRFFPELLNQLNDVASIEVKTHSHDFTVLNKESKWYIPEKADYPAENNKVRALLFGFAELIPLEQKTSNPDFYKRINLEDINKKDSKAIQVTLANTDGKTLAALLLGKDQPSRSKPELTEVFVRQPGEPKSWLAVGSLPILANAIDWLNTDIIDIKEENIKSIELKQANGSVLKLFKSSAAEKDFSVADLPEKKEIDSPFSVNYVASTLGGLSLENVYPLQEIDFQKPSIEAKLETFTGLLISYQAIEKDNKTLVKLKADAQQEQAEQTAADLNHRFQQWAFSIPDYQSAEMRKTVEQLLKQPEKETESQNS